MAVLVYGFCVFCAKVIITLIRTLERALFTLGFRTVPIGDGKRGWGVLRGLVSPRALRGLRQAHVKFVSLAFLVAGIVTTRRPQPHCPPGRTSATAGP